MRRGITIAETMRRQVLRCSKYCEVLAKRTEDENRKMVYCEASEKFANTSMGLSIIEDQTIPELRRLKDQWKRLYEEGEGMDKYDQRVLLHQMNRIEGEIATKDMELAKIDQTLFGMDPTFGISKRKEISVLWGEIETKDLDEILDRKIEENKTALVVKRF